MKCYELRSAEGNESPRHFRHREWHMQSLRCEWMGKGGIHRRDWGTELGGGLCRRPGKNYVEVG